MTLQQRIETANKQLNELRAKNGRASVSQVWKIWSDNQISSVMVSTLVGLVVVPVGLVIAFSGGSEEQVQVEPEATKVEVQTKAPKPVKP